MIKNENDTVYKGENGFTQGIADYNRRTGERDEQLMTLWTEHHIPDEATLTFHPPEDPLRRIWSAHIGDLQVTRMVADRPYGEDIKFYGEHVKHGIYTYISGHGPDALLDLLDMSALFQEGDVFTIHYDRERKLEPWWTLETADNLLFKKPKAYEKKDESGQNSPVR
jgi:hypothetical protein